MRTLQFNMLAILATLCLIVSNGITAAAARYAPNSPHPFAPGDAAGDADDSRPSGHEFATPDNAALRVAVSSAVLQNPRPDTPAFAENGLAGALTISVGGWHMCALTSDKGVMCWGNNRYGAVGDGTYTDRATPVNVIGLFKGVSKIAAGRFHTCALTTAGAVACWGRNNYGQLGNNSTANSPMPVYVTGLSGTVISIAAGDYHTCVLTSAGVKCWGRNADGQLGNNLTADSHVPVSVTGLSGSVSAIAAGGWHTCALVTGGGVKCWGYNEHGELGNNATGSSGMPVDVNGLSSGAAAIVAGMQFTCALMDAGHGGGVKCWGSNSNGQLGNNYVANSLIPVVVNGLTGAKSISAGGYHACALLTAGGIICWGYNYFGQLGDGTTGDRSAPTAVSGLANAASVDTGFYFTCALLNSGKMKCWGSNYYGQLGNATIAGHDTPADVNGLTSGVGAISAGGYHTCAVAGGGVKCWGDNENGELGNNSTASRNLPVNVVGLGSGVSAIAAGLYHTCALAGGGVKCWGNNMDGELGNNSHTIALTPVNVAGLPSGVSKIAAGSWHTCALLTNGAMKCWGANDWGQLGNNSMVSSPVPVAVYGLSSGVIAITAGELHTCALMDAGHGGGVKCWGRNVEGELGNNSNSESHIPVSVSGLSGNVSAVSAGAYHTCALAGGGVKCWGYNGEGELGNNTSDNSGVPVAVNNLGSGVSAISAGGYHACAMISGGVKCWGYNSEGELGNNSTTDSSVPVDVLNPGNLSTITTGRFHTCALTGSGGVRCWGSFYEGQLGMGAYGYNPYPLDVIWLMYRSCLPALVSHR